MRFVEIANWMSVARFVGEQKGVFVPRRAIGRERLCELDERGANHCQAVLEACHLRKGRYWSIYRQWEMGDGGHFGSWYLG